MKLTPLLGSLFLTSCVAAAAPVPVTHLALAPVPAPFAEPAGGTAPVTAAPVAAAPDPTSNRVSIYIGGRSLDEDDWEPVEDQVSFAVEFAHEAPDSIIGWEVGLAGSAGEGRAFGIDFDGTTNELYGGVVKSFGDATVRPYIGGGLSIISAEFEGPGSSDDDASLAGYVHGGAAVHLTPTFFLGLDLRALFGSDVTVFGFDTDADYTQLALFLGWGF